MNALVLKWLTSSIVGLVVCSAIWLAGSLKVHPSAPAFRVASVSGSAVVPARARAAERAPLPAAYAASATLLGGVALR
ncbi:hypothetical protein LNV09_01900 [Paucibacter sp. B2R-40]|uniref:hypothetical protein n=1 Tax=Paucibacter sp. B2R-40 TaxID=2893554 RepID=UPI0021E408EB|nr:hypothetical protein [Paucibacter sp. B2R-40]MCV2352909.1 hypothetical protein [Paucibacter sp. B2R-40]